MIDPETAADLARAILNNGRFGPDTEIRRLARLVLAEADHREQMVKALRETAYVLELLDENQRLRDAMDDVWMKAHATAKETPDD